MHRNIAVSALALALGVPAAAQAHVSIHPNVIPRGASATLTLRVPNESDTASTTRIAVELPAGFTDVLADPPLGWSFTKKTERLSKPVKTDQGTIDTQVREVDFIGGRIAAGRFAQFPIAVTIPDAAPSVLTFKTVQSYSNGTVSRWIGPPSADEPAPTIDVVAANGTLLDVGGGEAGPAPGAGTQGAGAAPASAAGSSSSGSGGGGDALAIVALIVGALGLVAGAAGLAAARRAGAAR